ncbi:hypothetical protein KBC79_05425 [Candidatus Woesebacteria bacterium]|nr:hypothetical protein [Candidatus Woesebacteria bacterium]
MIKRVEKNYLQWTTLGIIAGVLLVVMTQFSPKEQPLLIPVVMTLICLSLFFIITGILDFLKIEYNFRLIVIAHVILGVILGLFTLHQLRISDVFLIIGLAVLLRLYSKR